MSFSTAVWVERATRPSVEGKNTTIITNPATMKKSRRFIKKTIFAGLAVFTLSALTLALWVANIFSTLPDVSILKRYRPSAAGQVVDRDGAILAVYYDHKFRIWIPVSSLPDFVIHAVTTAEDDTFFDHKGVNYKAAWDALVHDVQKRRFARGGSTITQQMIKNVLLSREKTISRKVREYFLALKAEELLTKRKILEIYLNEVEWGDDIYGIEAASRFYLDKHASEMTVGEAALLAGMLPNPHYYNPFKRPGKARDRQRRVLGNMLQAQLINRETYESAIGSSPVLRQENSGRFDFSALKPANGKPCYHHVLEQVLLRLFGDQALYRRGWMITTTLDKKLQDELNRLEEGGQENSPPSREVTIVQQGYEIRGIMCSSGKETAVRETMDSLGLSPADFEITTVSVRGLEQDQLILSVNGKR